MSAADQVGKSIAFSGFKPFEQTVFAIIAEHLGSGGEGDDFEVGKLGYNAAMGAVPVPVYTIPGVFLDYFKNLSELYDEVVHKREDGNQWFFYH